MRNITKLSIWPKLQALGFEPINFRAHGKKVAIGAALRRELTSISGEKFKTDIICIEPHNFSDKKSYHVTGEVKTPYCEKLYRYDFCRKVEIYEIRERINEFYKATEILPIIEKMLS